MQAQLLSTVPSRSIDIGDGQASNEESFDFVQPVATRPQLRLAPASEAVFSRCDARAAVTAPDVDYWLGGYAGI